jgi:ubiquinone/menaquinone biosynthesis C-methylase UbiE
VRRFSADYLARTREGMWADDRTALADLALSTRERVLDVGCGTGEFAAVLAEESPGEVWGVDADPALLRVAADRVPVVAGDATCLPFRTGSADLVACQALLVNLPAPGRAVDEFARVSTDRVAAVEPDNGAVAVSSTVEAEAPVLRRAREAFLAGVDTDVAPGDRVVDLFREAGLDDVTTRRYHHEKRVEPPYDDADLSAATRKATGEALRDHEAELRAALGDAGLDALREAWREMGRAVVDAMRAGEYRRVEVVPFDVTVGRV